ncbi:MAG: hypothetical protein Q4Q53_07025 [Methanocorpusculum sp.]|nr:hypothetical protein [Methanocorpusculum sp.]
MIKRLIVVLLLAFLLCGTAAAATMTVGVFDASNNNPIEKADVSITELNRTAATDVNGEAVFTVNSSTSYTISVEKNGYISKTETVYESYIPIYLSQETPVVVKVLDPSGNPVAGAIVFVDGEDAGKTNSAGIIHYPMKRNVPHEISVTADLFDNYRESKYIYSGDSAYIVNLKKTEITPTVYVKTQNGSPVFGAEITIDNGRAFYSDSNGKAVLTSKYTAGTHTIKIIKDGYEPYQSEILISTNTGDIVTKLNYSAVHLIVSVFGDNKPIPNAIVYVNDKAEGLTDSYGIAVLNQVPETIINLSASHEGYSSEKISYKVLAEQEQKVTINLFKDVPLALIIGVAAGIIITVLIVLLVILYRSRNNSAKFQF